MSAQGGEWGMHWCPLGITIVFDDVPIVKYGYDYPLPGTPVNGLMLKRALTIMTVHCPLSIVCQCASFPTMQQHNCRVVWQCEATELAATLAHIVLRKRPSEYRHIGSHLTNTDECRLCCSQFDYTRTIRELHFMSVNIWTSGLSRVVVTRMVETLGIIE